MKDLNFWVSVQKFESIKKFALNQNQPIRFKQCYLRAPVRKKIAIILTWNIPNIRVILLSTPTSSMEKLNPLPDAEAKSWIKTLRRLVFWISNNLFSDFWIAAKILFVILRKKNLDLFC